MHNKERLPPCYRITVSQLHTHPGVHGFTTLEMGLCKPCFSFACSSMFRWSHRGHWWEPARLEEQGLPPSWLLPLGVRSVCLCAFAKSSPPRHTSSVSRSCAFPQQRGNPVLSWPNAQPRCVLPQRPEPAEQHALPEV